MTLRETLALLRERGFTIQPDPYMGSTTANEAVVATGEGRFVLLVMPDTTLFPDAECYGDLEVWASAWDSLELLTSEGAEAVVCGGLYEFMRIFADGQPQDDDEGLLGAIPEDPAAPLG